MLLRGLLMQTEWVVMPNSSHIHLGKTYLFIIPCPLQSTHFAFFLPNNIPTHSPHVFLEKCFTLQFKGGCKIPAVERPNHRCTITLLYLEHYKHSSRSPCSGPCSGFLLVTHISIMHECIYPHTVYTFTLI